MNKIKTIINKEWAEVFKNRLVLFSVAFLPLIFVALPLITIGAIGETGGSDVPATLDSGSALPGYGEICVEMALTEGECLQIYMLDLFTLLFMILPVMIPVTIAAYSIVGEKTARSLEPLLATPITTVELILGKSLAAIIPAVVATWLGYLIYGGRAEDSARQRCRFCASAGSSLAYSGFCCWPAVNCFCGLCGDHGLFASE